MSEFLSSPVMNAASLADPILDPVTRKDSGAESYEDAPDMTGKENRPSAGVPKMSFEFVDTAAYSP